MEDLKGVVDIYSLERVVCELMEDRIGALVSLSDFKMMDGHSLIAKDR
jgi:hypothetical protein